MAGQGSNLAEPSTLTIRLPCLPSKYCISQQISALAESVQLSTGNLWKVFT